MPSTWLPCWYSSSEKWLEAVKQRPCALGQDEIDRRREAASQALASSRLDGYKPTEMDTHVSELWVTGRLDTEEIIQFYKFLMQRQ